MTEEIQRRLAIAVKAIQLLCRLDVQAWISRERMFDSAEEDWPDRLLSKMISEHMIDTGVRRQDGVPLYRVSSANRGKALGLFTALASDPSLMEKLVDPSRSSLPAPYTPARHVIIPPAPAMKHPEEVITATRPNPLHQPARVMIEVTEKLYNAIKVRAASRGVTVKAYLLELLASDGVRSD